MTTTYSSYSTNPNQQQSFYTNDLNGIIFEFTAINVSNTYLTLPTFENTSISGFNNVSAIAMIPVQASSLNNLFYFEGYDLSTNTVIPAMYGINTSYRFNTPFSDASLTYGAINTTGAATLKSDYVNYLAYAITGGYNLADIFSNETSLINGVVSMDTSFNNTINTSIASINKNFSTVTSKVVNLNNCSVFFDNLTNNSIYVQGSKALLDGLLSIASTARGQQFLTDIANQNASVINTNATTSLTSYYNIQFHAGDIVSIVLNYIPYNGNASSIIGTNLVYTRSYKILLKCI